MIRGAFAWLQLATLAGGVLSGEVLVAQSQAPACPGSSCPYLNPALPVDQRVKDLVGRMTLEEKVSQMQDQAVAIPRLSIPAYNWWNEALHGVARRGNATVFPQAIGLAATWDRGLLHLVGDTISTEARALFNQSPATDKKRYFGLTFWSPNVNIFRDPRWGRGQETYGEDPFLTGQLGVQFIRGVQGDDPKYFKAIATPKHYAVHSGPESLRHKFNVDVSKHDLEDTYLPAFRAAIVDGKADSIMCAYNAIDKAPACASTMLLKDHLRDDWGFKGFVVSDCDAVGDVAGGHHFAKDGAEASAVSVKAGTDLDCGHAYAALPAAVTRGLIQVPEIDASVSRLFEARFRLGMFDPPASVPWSTIAASENDSEPHRMLARKAALEATVLLKNNGVLPLKSAPHTIAIIGPTAESAQVMQGNYNGSASHPVYAREGFAQRFSESKVVYAVGANLAEGFTVELPSEAIHPEAGVKPSGLRAEYFDNPELAGTAKLTRVDRRIHFDWRKMAPIPMEAHVKFSVRWSGALQVPVLGDYLLTLSGVHDAPDAPLTAGRQRVRFYLDGKLLPAVAEHPQQAVLHAGDLNAHALKIEYVPASTDGQVELDWQLPNETLIADAVKVASSADVVIAFVGISPQLEGEEMNVHITGFDGGDKTDLNLPSTQQALLEALKKTGKPLVVVLNSGSAVAVNWAQKNADAVLEEWYPGEEGGAALAQLVAGDVSPSGRLPVTFYRSVEGLPAFTDYSMKNRTYRYFEGAVLYPFGYGLSYARFEYAQPRLSASQLTAGETLTAKITVKNSSAFAADEVVEAYLQAPRLPVSPKLFLAGFERIHLAAGESREVTIAIDARRMSEVDADGHRAVQPGGYTLWLGGGQPESGAAGAAAKFTVTGTKGLQD